MPIPEDYLNELRERLSITEVVGRRVTWDMKKSQPGKGDYWACCPFHGEKSPSFHVIESRDFFKCFGCHAKGNSIDFVMQLERVSFPEAVEILAAEAGMAPPPRAPREAAAEARRAALTDVTEAAVSFYRAELMGPRGAEARAYLERRGLSPAMIERFEIGYAPDARRGAVDALARQGHGEDAAVAVDVASRPDGGGAAYDRFRDRIMFPIRDARGRCIAFGGRALSKKALAKYVNSRETALFSKSRALYNVGPARRAAAHGAPVVVGEGYMDVIALVEAGYEGAVAPLGTALTDEQLALLWRMGPPSGDGPARVKEPIFALDGDDAGRAAADRIARLALKALAPGLSLRFALLPVGLDPDELLRNGGPAAVADALERAAPLSDHLWRMATDGADLSTPERKAALEAEIDRLVGEIADETVRRQYHFDFRSRKFNLFKASSGKERVAPGPERGEVRARGERRREGAWRGGPGRQSAPEGPSAALLSSRLAQKRALSPAERALPREGAMIVTLLNHPSLAERLQDHIFAATWANPPLDMARGAILSAIADQCDQSAPLSREALETAVDRQCGDGACIEMRERFELIAPRDARPDAPLEAAERALLDLLTAHNAEDMWRREIEDYAAEYQETTAHPDGAPHDEPAGHPPAPPVAAPDLRDEDEAAQRLQSAQRARRTFLSEAGDGGRSEDELSERLRALAEAASRRSAEKP